MERKVKVITLSTVLIAAILSGIAVMAYANGLNNGESTEPAVMLNSFGYCGGTGPIGRRGFGWGVGPITVSQEFKDNVINIAQNDTDLQNLLANGYNITDVRPIISIVVEADGTVTMKATTAIAMLNQNTTGRAFATVNVEAGKVTEIVILTRTVIEKP